MGSFLVNKTLSVHSLHLYTYAYLYLECILKILQNLQSNNWKQNFMEESSLAWINWTE